MIREKEKTRDTFEIGEVFCNDSFPVFCFRKFIIPMWYKKRSSANNLEKRHCIWSRFSWNEENLKLHRNCNVSIKLDPSSLQTTRVWNEDYKEAITCRSRFKRLFNLIFTLLCQQIITKLSEFVMVTMTQWY